MNDNDDNNKTDKNRSVGRRQSVGLEEEVKTPKKQVKSTFGQRASNPFDSQNKDKIKKKVTLVDQNFSEIDKNKDKKLKPKKPESSPNIADISIENYLLSDEEEEMKKKIMNRRSQKRFGHIIKFDTYKTSNLIKIICIILAIIIIPLEIFLQSVLQDSENNLIVNIQTRFGTDNEALQKLFKVPIWLVKPETTTLFMCLFFLCTDSLIAFKSGLLTCFGIYVITFLKLLYKDGRPFWLSGPVEGLICSFDFGGPAYHLFIISFFWCYNIIMYGMKYVEKLNKPLVGCLFIFLILMSVWIILAGLYTGTIYIYQNIIGSLYGFIYLVFCLNFDTELHRLCEKTGFIVQSSRKYKFYLFFLCIGLFVVALIYYNAELDFWTMPQSWVVNASEVRFNRLDLFSPMKCARMSYQITPITVSVWINPSSTLPFCSSLLAWALAHLTAQSMLIALTGFTH